jgi:hypothetical protein
VDSKRWNLHSVHNGASNEVFKAATSRRRSAGDSRSHGLHEEQGGECVLEATLPAVHPTLMETVALSYWPG